MKKMENLNINDTTIRDLFQETGAVNINLKKIENLLKNLDEAGFSSLEVWGGASFERLLENNLGKNPWYYLENIRTIVSKTPIQALIGAKNLTGYDYFPDDIIKRFIKLSVKSGVKIFRIYDALNDIENMKFIINEIIQNNSECQASIIYNENQPIEFYLEFAERLLGEGASSICIKDNESILTPKKIREIFTSLPEEIKNNTFLSTKNLKGIQILNYFEAIENGCSGIDLSFIYSKYFDNYIPPIFPFVISQRDLISRSNVNIEKISSVFEIINSQIYPLLKKDIKLPKLIFDVDNKSIPPKWLISAIEKQLEQIGQIDKLDEVLKEMIEIKMQIGNPSFTTPISQIIGGQAILNTVICDNKWEIVSDEMQALIKGEYGEIKGNIDKDIKDNIERNLLTSDNFIKNNIIFEECKKELRKYSNSEEDILSYCIFPEKTLNLFEKKIKIKSSPIKALKKESEIEIDVKDFEELEDKGSSNLDTEKIKQIVELLESSNLDEITIETGETKIKLTKSSDKKMFTEDFIEDLRALTGNFEKISSPKSKEEDKSVSKTSNKLEERETKTEQTNHFVESQKENIKEIRSPIVGTFYSSPEPGKRPFVLVGQKVRKGDVVCIIEAMKLMNKIVSDYDGIIEEILVKDEEPVDFDKVLMKVRVES